MAEPVMLAVPVDRMAPRPNDVPHEPEHQPRRIVTPDSPPKGRQPLFRR